MSLTEAILQVRENQCTLEEVEIEVRRYETSVEKCVRDAKTYDVCSKWSAEEAQTMVVQARGQYKQLEVVRKALVDPHRKIVSSINDMFKSLTERLEKAEEIFTSKIDLWKAKVREEEKAKEQEAKEIADSLEIEAVLYFPETSDKIRSKGASSYEVTEWKFSAENLHMVPREFLKIDEDKVKLAIKMGTREIPGLKIYSEQKTIIRSR